MKMTTTQRITNRSGITDQYKRATSGARRDFGYDAAELQRCAYRINLLSVTNTGDETVFEFTAQALRPLHYHYRLWRDHRQAQWRKANRRKWLSKPFGEGQPMRWFYPNGTQASEHMDRTTPHRVSMLTSPLNTPLLPSD